VSEEKSVELRVSVDVGYRRHSVAMGLPSGEVLEEFEIDHRPEGFQEFFSRIEKHQKKTNCAVAVAMEGYNGYARPLDSLVRQRGYRLYNLNNLKFARFKEIFPGAAGERPDRCAQGVGVVSAKRSPAVGQGSASRSERHAQRERNSQANNPAPSPVSQRVEGWQKRAHFSQEVEWVGEMIQEDAKRCLELDEKIKRLETKIAEVARGSKIAKILRSMPGFGAVCTSELAGEIGTIERFGSEGSLSLYLGMSTLDNSSGKYQGTKAPKHVNTRAKAAMMIAVDRHRKYVPESQRYYEKKRSEGKKHNQAIRALGRHLARIIYKMLKEEREYEIRPEKGNTKTKVSPRSSLKTQIRKPKISAQMKK
ncbi:MAG: transposase, partial [Candidatus Binatia bacterium]